MKQIYYWRDIYGDFNLFAPYQYTIHRLFQGERSGLHFEKLRQTGTLAIYSIRLNSADRLLFTIYKDSICLLDVVLNHDYAKSRFLRHPNKVYDFIKTMIHADEIAWETSIDALPSSRAPAKFQPIDYFQHQFIILNAVQESILTTAIPAIISGPAGSGKTCSAIALLNQKACYYEEPIAYITRSRPLLESMKTMWKETYPEDIKVDFKTYDELYPGLSDAPDFYHWLSGQGMCGAGLPISPEQLWQEFRIRSGFEDDLSYFNLGQRQSTVLPTERHTINDLYHRYLDSHPSSILNTFTHRQPYQFIVVDEAQDLAYAQLKSLYFASYTQIIYLLGSHQILFDNISRTDYLKSLFYQSGYKTEVIQLPISYRSGEEVVKITNALIDLKTAVIGGASDKYESHLHVAEELKDQGRFELRSTSQNEDFLSPGPELAIITLPQLKEEAGAKFDTPLVFSVDEIKGLEFHTILIWKFLTDPKASIIAKKLSIPSDSAKTLHRAKTGQAHPEHLPLCDAWITAASRAKQHLVWFDDLEHGTRTIYQHLQKYSSKDKIISASAEKSQDWKTVYETLLHEGANQQAEAVYRQRLTQTSDLSAPKDDTSCSDFSTDYLVLKKFISSKKKLKLDPKIKKKLQETNIALNPILYLLKQEDGSEMIHQLQLKLPPNTIPHTIWLQACDEKSLSLIQLLSLENPKLAISIMDKFPKDTLSLLNFDPQQKSSLTHIFCKTELGRKCLIDTFSREPNCLKAFNELTKINSNISYVLSILVKRACQAPKERLAHQLTMLNLRFNEKNSCYFKEIGLQALNKHDLWVIELLAKWEIAYQLIFIDNLSLFHLATKKNLLPCIKILAQKKVIDLPDASRISPLIYATKLGYLKTVQYLHEQGADLNYLMTDNASALIIACQENHRSIIEYLCDHGANINQATMQGTTPLIEACYHHNLELVQYLILKGANIEQTLIGGASPLYISAEKSYDSIVKCLCAHGANPNTPNTNNFVPLIRAAYNGDLRIVQYLIDSGADINLTLANGETALFNAALKGHFEMTKYLCRLGARINQSQKCPIYVSAQNNYLEILQYLYSCGGKINQTDDKGATPLIIAAQQGHLRIVSFLCANGANINHTKNDQATALFVAAQQGHFSIVKHLCSIGVELNLAISDNTTALFVAIQNGHTDIAIHLIDQGADIEKSPFDSCSPLFLAAHEGNATVAKYLIEAGANKEIKNKDGLTPLYIAAQEGHQTIVQYLLEIGLPVNVNSRTTLGVSPLHIAAQQGHHQVLQYLCSKGAYVNQVLDDNATPLFFACKRGHLECVKILCRFHANPEILTSYGDSPLSIAIAHHHHHISKYLNHFFKTEINPRKDHSNRFFSLSGFTTSATKDSQSLKK